MPMYSVVINNPETEHRDILIVLEYIESKFTVLLTDTVQSC